MDFLDNLKTNLTQAFHSTPTPAVVSRTDVLGLEEHERTRRIAQASQSHHDMQNAANLSGIIKGQSFPIFKGNVSKGYKRVTTRFEEDERRRRLTNKSESALRRKNANKTAAMLKHLGWPFYQQNHAGTEYIVMDPTKILEEDEREWRTSRQYWTPTAKHNAAMLANILRWGNFQKNPKSGFKQHLKYLSEKERRDRLRPDAFITAMENSYNEANSIKKMGAPFYVQEIVPSQRNFTETHKLEERERVRRMLNPDDQQLARELAGIVGHSLHLAPSSIPALSKDLSNQDQVLSSGDKDLEEQERGRRISDTKQQKLAMANAKNVSLMVRESSSNKISGTGPMWFSITRNSMRALEEIERTRRVRDIEGQRFAVSQAKSVADLINNRSFAPTKPDFHGIVEQERQSRMVDRAGQQLAMKNARKVSGMIARHNIMSSGSRNFFNAIEEGERSRRLQDNELQSIARDNAKKVSSLFSTLLTDSADPISRPLSPTKFAPSIAPTQSLPTFSAPISPAPVAVSMPVTPVQSSGPILSAPIHQAPISSLPAQAPVATHIASPLVAPIQQAPILSAPISATSQVPISTPISAPISAPISTPISAPISTPISAPISAPIQQAPILSAPISAPISQVPLSAPISAAPVYSAPVSAVPISSAPVYSAPVSAAPISVAPVSAAPISSAPIYSAPASAAPISAAPIYSAPVSAAPISSAPIYSAPVSAAPISAAPTYSAPVSAAPISSAPIYAAPASAAPNAIAPNAYYGPVQPMVLPSTSAPVPVAPLATAMPTVGVPVARQSAPIVPIDPNAIAYHPLGDRERKRIEKQVDKQNRKSERDIRKAEKSMIKAEKMHQKGRDDKALKLEGRADLLMKNAEHKRKYASGLNHELNTPAPASM